MAQLDKNLRAFVRFDGSGRIVASSLILRKRKPKVGKWKEILANECCDITTTSTTTTLFPPTTTTTTTATPSFALVYYVGSYDATTPCSGLPTEGIVNYSSTSDPLILDQLFSDAALTTTTIMSNGGGYYTFSYDGGVTYYSAQFTPFGTVVSSITPC